MTENKSDGTNDALSDANKKILKNLEDRSVLLKKARDNELEISAVAAVILQTNERNDPTKDINNATGLSTENSEEVLEAVEYRLAITDLFVEKAQYHLEDRAGRYKKLGYLLYSLAILMFASGAAIACYRMFHPENKPIIETRQQSVLPKILATTSVLPVVLVPNQPPAAGQWVASQVPITASVPATVGDNPQPATAILAHAPVQRTWIDLLYNFIANFTAYGFIVLTAVVLTRGARACLDQRERLLAKRHSLRQGRLYLHLSGGRVTINDMEHAFNWNHEQQNAFTNMSTDAKAPWGNVIEEIIRIVPELVKTGVVAAEKGKTRDTP